MEYEKQGPFQSVEFRRAFNLILNRSEMIRELGDNRLYPARGFIMDEQAPYRKDRYDPEFAKSLLSQSGYDGSPSSWQRWPIISRMPNGSRISVLPLEFH